MTLRREREQAERRRRRLYEAVLAAGVALLAGGLILAFGVVLAATVFTPRPRPPDPSGLSTHPAAAPAPPRP